MGVVALGATANLLAVLQQDSALRREPSESFVTAGGRKAVARRTLLGKPAVAPSVIGLAAVVVQFFVRPS